jgi:hypothetical protein
VQHCHVVLHPSPELVVIVAFDDVPAQTNDPQRHREPPDESAAIVTPDRCGRKLGRLAETISGVIGWTRN